MKHGINWLAASLLLSLTTFNAQATFTLSDNGLGIYDSGANVSWTQDANLLGTLEANAISLYGNDNNLITNIISANGWIVQDTVNSYDMGAYSLSASDFGAGGMVNWWGAQAFVGYLNSMAYAGSNQWALPTAIDNDDSVGYNQTSSQLGELFYNALGGAAGSSIPSGPFSNVQLLGYWSGTEYASNPDNAWVLGTLDGNQFYYDKNTPFIAWAVSPDNISTVPVPSSVWLFSSGIVGLIGLKRRQNDR